jgi:hypothetical protein
MGIICEKFLKQRLNWGRNIKAATEVGFMRFDESLMVFLQQGATKLTSFRLIY